MGNEGVPQRMVDKPETPQPLTLKRWSQRKRDAARKPATPEAAISVLPAAAPAIADAAPVAATEPELVPLPPVESLDFESDYAAFMQPKVNEETRRAALKKLFSDPSFNVMDGLDIYTGDYTQADPMPAGMLDKLSAVYAMLDPVKPPPDAQPPAGESFAAVVATPDPVPQAAPEVAAESPSAPNAAANAAEKPA